MRTNTVATAALLAAMAVPASAGEIYSFRATDYAIRENVSHAVNGVKISLVSSNSGKSPGVVDDPKSFNSDTFVPESRWLDGGAGGEYSCVPGGLGELLLFEFEQPITRFELVAYSVTASHVAICSDDPVGGLFHVFPQTLFRIEPDGQYTALSAGEVTVDAPLDRVYVGSVSRFGITEFRAEGISFVDEPMTGALLLGGVVALAGLRHRRS